MTEYIDKNKAINQLKTDVIIKYPSTFANGILTSAEEIAKMPTENVVSKTEYQELVNENAKLTDCVQDLLKDQDVLKQLLEKEREKSQKIFEELEKLIIRRMIKDIPFIDDRLITDIAKLKKKHIGETK